MIKNLLKRYILRPIVPVIFVIALRFLGLFIVLPVVSLYALNLEHSNKFLVGIMIGAYALTQLFLQIPFGILSDKIGRKITLIFGLVIFIIGSLICGYATDIYTLIIGRFLQGSGAIGAVGTAIITDMVNEEQRAKAMALMGGSIGIAFALSMVLGPLIAGHFGVNWLFYLTAILSIIAIFLLIFYVPNPPKITYEHEKNIGFFEIMRDKNLFSMNITNFLQKGLMTLAFLIIPILMVHKFGWNSQELYKAYAPAMICGLLVMGPSAIFGEKKGKSKLILSIGILCFIFSYLLLGYTNDVFWFIFGVVVFFIGFNVHEPIMQSMTSKYAKAHQKGASLGLFNAFGYAGTFLGGMLGGYILHEHSSMQIAWIVSVVCILWLGIIYILDNPFYHKNIYLKNANIDTSKLANINGIIEWYYKNEDLTIKYDSKKVDEQSILKSL